MTPWDLKRHLGSARAIIRENTIVIWWVVFIGLLSSSSLFFRETPLFLPVTIAVTALSVFSTPIIYGIYYQLIEDSYSSIPAIARTYVPGYLWLVIRMYLPPIVLAGLLISLMAGSVDGFGGGGILETTLVLFSLLFLFVIPVYYRQGSGNGAIVRGVSFLINNLSAATPVILAVLLLETSMLLLHYQRSLYGEKSPALFMALDFFAFVIASLIDYAIFIILIFILKEHDTPMNPSS